MSKSSWKKKCEGCQKIRTFHHNWEYNASNRFCSRDCYHAFIRVSGASFNQYTATPWKQSEDDILRAEYPHCASIKELAQQLGRSKWTVNKRSKKLGLGRTAEAIGKSRKIGGRKNKGNSRPDLAQRNKLNPMRGKDNPFYGKTHSDETRQVISASQKVNSAFIRLNKDPDFQQKRREAHGKKMKDPEYRAKAARILASTRGGQNKSEKKLDVLIQELYPDEYAFTGDGSFIIDGLNPDWVNINGQKKIIELFGEHVHHTKKAFCRVGPRATYAGRKRAFAKFGYKTLIIWSRALKDMDAVKTKLREFHEDLCD